MRREYSFTSETCHLADLRREVRGFLDECSFDENTTALLVLAIDEAFTNIIRYAYAHACEQPIEVTMDRLPDRVRFILRDFGKPCDPERIRSRDLDDIRPGGLGVFIIQKAFDFVRYFPQPDGTKLVLEKKFIPAAG